MKNKKGFILFGLLTIISCFFCIGSAKAVYFYDTELTYEFFNDVWNTKIKGTSYQLSVDNTVYYNDISEYPYIFCTIESSTYLSCFFSKYATPYKSGTSLAIRYTEPTKPYSTFGVGFKMDSKGVISNTIKHSGSFIFNSFNGTYYLNFDYILDDEVLHAKNLDINFDSHVINFHLNGGHSIDMSDPFDWQFSYEDYSVSLYPNEIHDYISHLTFIKEKHVFNGLYYDEDFTMPYSPNDNITSDIDLYAKFTSKIYYTNDIDYIEIKFDNLPLAETNISYDYMIRSVNSDGTDNTIDFSQPHGREFYTGCDDDNSNCSPNLRYKDKLFYDMDFIGYYYTYHEDLTFNADAYHITSSYSVIIPLETSIANWIYVDFDCDYDYEIIVHYKNDINDNTSVSNYLETIDLTNKYGAFFLPLYDNTAYADEGSYYLTHFKVIGTVDVQVTDSREMTGYNILQLYSMGHCNYSYEKQDNRNDDTDLYINKSIPYSCDNNTGIFKFKIDHNTAGQTLRFVNVNYSSSADVPVKITYDTRFFNYGILDTPYSIVDIIDPTTGEVEHVGLSEFYNQLNKNENNKSFKLSLNRFIKPIKFIFQYVTKIFSNYLSASLQDYFFFVFCLALIILIVRVIF